MVDDPAFRILSRLCSCIVTVLAVISQADKIMCCPIGRRKGKDSGDPRLAGRNVDNQVYGLVVLLFRSLSVSTVLLLQPDHCQ